MSVVAKIRITSDLWPGVMCWTMWIMESIATSGLSLIKLQTITTQWQITCHQIIFQYLVIISRKLTRSHQSYCPLSMHCS